MAAIYLLSFFLVRNKLPAVNPACNNALLIKIKETEWNKHLKASFVFTAPVRLNIFLARNKPHVVPLPYLSALNITLY
jgi:hypothetical protein